MLAWWPELHNVIDPRTDPYVKQFLIVLHSSTHERVEKFDGFHQRGTQPRLDLL